MSEAREMAARLPPIAWVMPNDRCRDNGSLDAMAWQEGEFSTPLCSRADALSLIDRQTAEIEALRAQLKQEQEDNSEMLLIAHLDGATRNREAHANEVEALKAATAWRPIETAPRDGTHILARLTRERILDMDGRMMPKFSEIREIWYQPFTMFGVSVPWHAGDPFDGDDIASTHMGDDVPTEWMPLPSAPKEPTP